MICYLPTIKSSASGFDSLAEFFAAGRGLFSDKLELDFSRCGFFDANMAAPLAAVLARIADKYNTVEIVNVQPSLEKILSKNDFLVYYRYPKINDYNQTTIPFRRIQLSDSGRFEDYLQRHLKGKGIPQMTDGLGKVFKQSIFEVFQNSVIHSESRLGIFVCGQFFPQLQRVDLTIADAGVGIRTKVRRHLQNNKIASVGAIKWALTAGNTTKEGRQPGGLGLQFLKDFINLNKGKIQIASRFGFYEFKNGTESYSKLGHDFPGTVVNLEVNTADTSSYCLASEVTSEDIF